MADPSPGICVGAGIKDPLASMRDGKSFAPLLLSDEERARSPDSFRTGFLIEKLYADASDTWVSIS